MPLTPQEAKSAEAEREIERITQEIVFEKKIKKYCDMIDSQLKLHPDNCYFEIYENDKVRKKIVEIYRTHGWHVIQSFGQFEFRSKSKTFFQRLKEIFWELFGKDVQI